MGGARITVSAPRAALSTDSVDTTTVSLLITATPLSSRTTSGSGAPAIIAAARAVRRTPSSNFARTSSLYERMVTRKVAVSGMMLPTVPACTAPTVMTPNSIGSFSRLTTVCTLLMKCAAITIGSIVLSGAEPWPPRPWNVISRRSEFDVIGPMFEPTVPQGWGPVCSANATSGFPKRVNRPSARLASDLKMLRFAPDALVADVASDGDRERGLLCHRS
jgi:hypothetical protein